MSIALAYNRLLRLHFSHFCIILHEFELNCCLMISRSCLVDLPGAKLSSRYLNVTCGVHTTSSIEYCNVVRLCYVADGDLGFTRSQRSSACLTHR